MDLTTQDFLEFLATLPGPKLHEMSPEDARMALRAVSAGTFATPPVALREVTSPLEADRHVRVTLVRPRNLVGHRLPIVIYIHGGGWVLGDYEVFSRCVAELANSTGAMIAFVQYSLAPGARFPTPIEECYAAAKWLAENADQIDGDATKLAIIGESAGGAIAAAVAQLANTRRAPSIAAQVLYCPVANVSEQSDSMRQFADGYFLTEPMMKWCLDHYGPDPTSPLASPALAPLAELQGQPPALIVTAEFDPVRDEGESYARKLLQAGVRVTATRYLGTIHAFMSLNQLRDTAAARAVLNHTSSFLRQIFVEPVPEK
jgi:acetyl esterase